MIANGEDKRQSVLYIKVLLAVYFIFFFSLSLQRLNIAREFGDKAAERRAHSNLGNAHIFLGEFETAAEHYK